MALEPEISNGNSEGDAEIKPQLTELVVEPMTFSGFIVKFLIFNVFVFGVYYFSAVTFDSMFFATVVQLPALFIYVTWGFVANNNERLRQEPEIKGFFRKPFVQGCGVTLYSFFYLVAGMNLFGSLTTWILFLVPNFSLVDPYASIFGYGTFFPELSPLTLNQDGLLVLLGSALSASWLASLIANGLKKGTNDVLKHLLPSTIGLAINAMPYAIAYTALAASNALIISMSAVMISMNAFGDVPDSALGLEFFKAMPWYTLPPLSAAILLIFYRNSSLAFFKVRQSPSSFVVSLVGQPLSIWGLSRKLLTSASVLVVIAFSLFPIIDGLKATVGIAAIKPTMGAYDGLRAWMDGELADGAEPQKVVDKIGEGYWSSEFPKDGLTHLMPEFESLMEGSGAKTCRIRLTSRVLSPELRTTLAPKVIKGDGIIWQNEIAYCMRVTCSSEALPKMGEKTWLFSSHNSDKNYWMGKQHITNNLLSNEIKNAGGFCTKEGLLADEYQG